MQWQMGYWRRYPPDQNWLSDLIQTLLMDEMFRRQPELETAGNGHKRIIFIHQKWWAIQNFVSIISLLSDNERLRL